MEINIRYFNIFQKILNREEETINLPPQSKLRDLLEKQVVEEGEKIKDLILTPRGEIRPALKVYVNGQQEEKYSRELEDGDQVYLFIAFPGG